MVAKLLRANIAYAVGSAGNSIALVLLVPYLINTLPASEYGLWALFEIQILLLSMLCLAGLDIGLMREYWFLQSDDERQRLTGTVLISVCIWSGTLVVVLWIGQSLLDGSNRLPPVLNSFSNSNFLHHILAISYVESIFTLLLTLLRIREQPVYFVLLSVLRMFLFTGGVILGVHAGGGVGSALDARLIAGICGTAIVAIILRNHFKFVFDRQYFKRVVRYGLPLLPTNLALYVLLASDRFVLRIFSSLEIVGIYSFAYKLATTLDVIVTRPFALDWSPRRFKIATQSDATQKYAMALIFYLFVGSGFALLVTAITPSIYTWLAPPSYRTGMTSVPVILVAYLVYGLSYPLNIGIMLKNKTIYLPLIGGVSAVACLILNFVLIPTYSILGAAWATLLAYTIWTSGIFWISANLYHVTYPLRLVLLILAGAILGYLGLYSISLSQIEQIYPILTLLIRVTWVTIIFSLLGYILLRSTSVRIPSLRETVQLG